MINQYSFNNFCVRVFQQQKAGMDCCGDSFFIKETENLLICGIADGLGSGRLAKEASDVAIQTLEDSWDEPFLNVMDKVNQSQQNHRGVVMSLFRIDLLRRNLTFCGIGNINLIINDNQAIYNQPLPTKGYMSGKPTRFRVQEYPLPDEGWFALFSDGIRIHSKQLPLLYRILESSDEKVVTADVNIKAIRNLNDDVTLMIGKFN